MSENPSEEIKTCPKNTCPLWIFVNKNNFGIKSNNHEETKKRKWNESTPKSSNDAENAPTHFNLYPHKSFGKIRIPESHYDEFLRIYTDSIAKGHILSLSEQKTPIFKFFIDMDIKASKKIDQEQILEFVRDILLVVKRFYHDMPQDLQLIGKTFTCIVTTPNGGKSIESKDLLEQDTFQEDENPFDHSEVLNYQDLDQILHPHAAEKQDPIVKNGIHIHFPWLHVTCMNALFIRESLIEKFNSKYGTVYGHSKWDHIFDECIYLSNGIRMTYSLKAMACKSCYKGEKQTFKKTKCTQCNDGYIFGPRYEPIFVLNGHGEKCDDLMEKMIQNPYSVVKFTSIRCKSTDVLTPHFKVYENAPQYILPSSRKVLADGTMVYSEDEKIIGSVLKSMEKIKNGNLILEVQKFINQHMGSPYECILIQDIYLDIASEKKNQLRYIVRVQRCKGAWYCQNKKGEHNSSQIYFEITDNGMSQRCWCKKGDCRKYKSPPKKLTPFLYNELFKKNSIDAHMKVDHTTLFGNDKNKTLQELDNALMLLEADKNQIERKQQRKKSNQFNEEESVKNYINQVEMPEELFVKNKKRKTNPDK